MTQFIPDRLTTIKQTPPPSGVFLAPPSGDDWRQGGVAVWKCTLCGSQTQASVWGVISICTESFFFPPSLPCNYAAAECLSGTSGWSRHFLPHVHHPGRRTSPPLALLPQQTSPSENLPENNLLDYIITFTFNSRPPAACPKKRQRNATGVSKKKQIMREHFMFRFFCEVNQTWWSSENTVFTYLWIYKAAQSSVGWMWSLKSLHVHFAKIIKWFGS